MKRLYLGLWDGLKAGSLESLTFQGDAPKPRSGLCKLKRWSSTKHCGLSSLGRLTGRSNACNLEVPAGPKARMQKPRKQRHTPQHTLDLHSTPKPWEEHQFQTNLKTVILSCEQPENARTCTRVRLCHAKLATSEGMEGPLSLLQAPGQIFQTSPYFRLFLCLHEAYSHV